MMKKITAAVTGAPGKAARVQVSFAYQIKDALKARGYAFVNLGPDGDGGMWWKQIDDSSDAALKTWTLEEIKWLRAAGVADITIEGRDAAKFGL